MSTVWVYPDRKFEEIGAVRYRLSWEEVRPGAESKDDIDHDEDILSRSLAYKTKEAAMKKAKTLVEGCKTAYGEVSVIRQVVDWYVEEDRIAEWVDTSDVEYVN